jgi:hypothetical protein
MIFRHPRPSMNKVSRARPEKLLPVQPKDSRRSGSAADDAGNSLHCSGSLTERAHSRMTAKRAPLGAQAYSTLFGILATDISGLASWLRSWSAFSSSPREV